MKLFYNIFYNTIQKLKIDHFYLNAAMGHKTSFKNISLTDLKLLNVFYIDPIFIFGD